MLLENLSFGMITNCLDVYKARNIKLLRPKLRHPEMEVSFLALQ